MSGKSRFNVRALFTDILDIDSPVKAPQKQRKPKRIIESDDEGSDASTTAKPMADDKDEAAKGMQIATCSYHTPTNVFSHVSPCQEDEDGRSRRFNLRHTFRLW